MYDIHTFYALPFKLAKDILVVPLTHIINKSLLSGTFPSSWKVGRVTPVWKKGPRDDWNNYRPISCLSIPAKILEACAKSQIADFFERNNLFGTGQHGFRPHRSTTSALVAMTSAWTDAVDRNHNAGALAFDLSSAFDTVDVNILCSKLAIYGFDTVSLSWIRSYLTNRHQFVQVGNIRSKTLKVNTGCPQGSVLSPILFIILTADIEDWVQHSELSSYADDITATATGLTPTDVIVKLQKSAHTILSFFASNGLVVNTNKTVFLFFGS